MAIPIEIRSMSALGVQGAARMYDTEYYAEGYATTFDTPYLMFEYGGTKYYERVSSDALSGAEMSDVIFQYDHMGRIFARTSNDTMKLSCDGHGLLCGLNLGTTDGAKDIFTEIKTGLITKMSWRFIVRESAYDMKTHTRTIQKIARVLDLSAVSIPANPDTEISARGYSDEFKKYVEDEKRERDRVSTLIRAALRK